MPVLDDFLAIPGDKPVYQRLREMLAHIAGEPETALPHYAAAEAIDR
jgi:hypothetical protein